MKTTAALLSLILATSAFAQTTKPTTAPVIPPLTPEQEAVAEVVR